MMQFKFDPNQQFQRHAIDAVVDLFDGQPSNVEHLRTSLVGESTEDEAPQLIALEIGAVGNNLLLDEEVIFGNLQIVQNRNGLEISQSWGDGSLDFDIEMETGTGKTYVYLRTIFELAKRYNFTKFIILVPSVAIKEGVITSIRLMEEHFKELYAIPFDSIVYSGKSAEEVQPFATSTNVQIMIITIDSIRGDKNSKIIHQNRDKLNGLRPIEYLAATRPVIIMDEPQNMESELSQVAIADLKPLCTLRYSATHRVSRNVIYRLDPVDAHALGIVKQIVVSDVLQQGADAKPYIKLVEVKRNPWIARLELSHRQADGTLARKIVPVPLHKDLSELTGNAAYQNNWRINEINFDPAFIELTNHGILQLGETIGGNNDFIYREMIRETIKEHLRKEAQLRSQGIKVLSLFFVDKVANYLDYSTDGSPSDGQFAKWFDELFIEERDKSPIHRELLPEPPQDLRRAYFSVMKSRGHSQYVDTTERGNAGDDDAYDLIMRDKARLLDNNEPVRFIFSHSALREGWDNPNVFQICALREMGKTLDRRQTIGRGLRLPVNQSGERVPDRSVAQLTIIANESYSEFAKSLQDDYISAGVNIGHVRLGEFSKLPWTAEGKDELLGYRRSEEIFSHLKSAGFIDENGRVLGMFNPALQGFTLNLPTKYQEFESEVITIIDSCKIEHIVKSARNREVRNLNKELYLTPEFEDFWARISGRTTYRVSVDRESIIAKTVSAIKSEKEIQPLLIQVTRAGIKILRGGARAEEIAQRQATLAGTYDLPDIVTELQETTSLTRKSIIDILIQCGRLNEFIHNPNDFTQMVKRCILSVLAASVIDGIQYEKIAGSVYELRELQKDGLEERDRFIDQMYKVKNRQKTDFDQIVYESSVEQKFAELLDSREDVKMFMKLPAKFKIPTPVGDYNPDWAIIKQVDGADRIYMIRETKSNTQENLLRPNEAAKIKYATKHFAAINITDYAAVDSNDWKL
jgi:type III restriction enzyme